MTPHPRLVSPSLWFPASLACRSTNATVRAVTCGSATL
jgi:hypothetical protein